MLLNSLFSAMVAIAVQSNPVVVVSPHSGSAHGYAPRSLSSTVIPKTYKFLVVPVRFAGRDSTFSVDSLSKSFDGNRQDVTVRRFYQEQSKGKVDMTFKFLPWMLSKVPRDSLGHRYSYFNTADEDVATEAITYALSLGQNMSEYDNDKDGVLDGLILIFAGSGYQETHRDEDPFAARNSLAKVLEPAPGVFVQNVLHLLEVDYGKAMRACIPAHELGHFFGASDLYDVNRAQEGQDGGVGNWDIMCTGGEGKWWLTDAEDPKAPYKPSGFCAFSRMRLGWDQPIEIESNQEIRLKPGEAARLWTDSLRASEYLLLENRDRSGVDSVLPGPGLLVMRVRTEKLILNRLSDYQDLNSDSSAMGVELLEASGLQRTHRDIWVQPLPSDLFGLVSTSLSDSGPVSLKRTNGASSGAWIRQIRVEGDDVVFQANPAPKRGYSLASAKEMFNGSYPGGASTVLYPMRIPEPGKIVAMTSVLPQEASTICVGVWDAFSGSGVGTPLASACDSGGFASEFRKFHHDLKTPISVKTGQVIWVGQSIAATGGNTNFAFSTVDPEVDTTWMCISGNAKCSFCTARPSIDLLVQTDIPQSPVSGKVPASSFAIRRHGDQVRIFGGRTGESLLVVLRDLTGRILASGGAICDGNGTALVEIPSGVAGMVLVEAKGSFGSRSQILSKP